MSARSAGVRRGAGPGFGAVVLTLAIALVALAAAWPIYRDPRAALTVLAAAAAALGVVWAGTRWRWGIGTGITLAAVGVALLVPAAVPTALGGGARAFFLGLGDGLAAVALGWKQLLTLTLPVGHYQTVLVPLFVVVLLSVAAATRLAAGGQRAHACAALPILAPLLFGTVFGPATPSDPIRVGPIPIDAPRELALWGASAVVVTAWIAWSSGRARRAALRLGGGHRAPGRRLLRGGLAALLTVCALAAGTVLAPGVTATPRTIPRDQVDPVVVVRAQSSPLSGYRVWKRDAAFDAPLFTVTSEGALPERLRLAVLDDANGVDFAVTAERGTFTRFPSGTAVADPSWITVQLVSGATGIWVPLPAELGEPPRFTGARAAELADGFFLDRDTGAGIAVPTAAGLRAGDGYTASASAAPDPRLDPVPATATPQLDRTAFPELDRWLRMQQLPATGAGLERAVELLRERGYLSHALSDDPDARAWLDELSAEFGTRFVASAGGHSDARIEELFGQLADRQAAAGDGARGAELVAGIGDDEQFAVAAARLAEAFGYESRVVLGVRLAGAGAGADAGDSADAVPGVPACAETCTGRNIAAWAEARGADGVWAPLDATPQVTTPPASLTEGERLPEHPTVPEERDAHESDPEYGAGTGDTAADPAPQRAEPGSLWAWVRGVSLGLLGVLLLATLALFILAVKALRTRRRRRATHPEVRALGAWEEFVDVHVDAGALPPRGGSAAAESRRELGARLPGGTEFAARVDHAVFSPEGTTAAEAGELWSLVDRARDQLRAQQSAGARLRTRFTLASFGIGRGAAGRTRSGAATTAEEVRNA
ncbi:hypothetical protein [Leucobacter chromiireducens]|uniref:hypothetical protein n=1 Tax=Leucobacter chromiireducens TaxID=283877 RepID=UPI001F14CE79|nr:hypothetical protein [Leucobacter chromiireducens]